MMMRNSTYPTAVSSIFPIAFPSSYVAIQMQEPRVSHSLGNHRQLSDSFDTPQRSSSPAVLFPQNQTAPLPAFAMEQIAPLSLPQYQETGRNV
jgi:hypothetical protein